MSGSTLPIVEIYTDGACSGNPGPGGWGVLLRLSNGTEKTLKGAQAQTTNNRMELQAAIEGFKALEQPCKIDIFTDSEYVKNGITRWIIRWRQRGWKTTNGTEVKNKELWQTLEAVSAQHEVTWHWVKGHSGHVENEQVDALARLAIDELHEKRI